MRERLFPRWCTALFALLPMSELLYLAADGQSVYAAALACTVCALAGIGAARLSDRVRHSAPAQWVLAGLAVSAACIHRPHEHFPAEDRVHRTLMRQHSCAADSLHPAHGINGAQPLCHVGTADCVACRYGTPALRCADIHTAYACQLFRTDSGIAAAIPAYSVLPAAGIGRTGVFSAGDQAVRKLLRTVLLLGANTAALLPYPAFTAAGLAAIGNFARHGEVFFAVPLLLCEIGRCAALVCVLLYPFTRTCGVLHLRRPQYDLGNTAQLKLRFLAQAPVALPRRFAQIALVQLCGIALVFLSQFCYNANSRAKEITA